MVKLDLVDKVVIGVTILITLIIVVMVSCGKSPDPLPPIPPVPPVPATDFSISGYSVLIQGKLKPRTPVTVDEAKRTFQIAVDMIDSKNK